MLPDGSIFVYLLQFLNFSNLYLKPANTFSNQTPKQLTHTISFICCNIPQFSYEFFIQF